MRILLATALVATSVTASITASAHESSTGYWGDGTSKSIWRNSYGECWQTGTWTKEQAIPECGAAAAAKAAPAAAPVAAAPADDGSAARRAAEEAARKAKEAADAAAAAAAAKAAEMMDGDGDGVSDAKDKCPNTKKGAKVNDDGCYVALKEKVTISIDVKFPTGSSQINAAGSAEVKKLADFMTQYPETTVEVGGHTDNVGSAATNTRLSQARADAVRAELIKKYGIDGGRVTAKGYGPDKPIADNSTVAGRNANRRVEGVVSQTVEKVQE